jgi:hypothetical protein
MKNIMKNIISSLTADEQQDIAVTRDYAEIIVREPKNSILRWKLNGNLVEEEMLERLFQNGYISANEMMTTINEHNRRSESI